MKKTILILAFLFSILSNAQNPTPFSNIKLTGIQQGTKSDSIATISPTKVVRFLPLSSLNIGVVRLNEGNGIGYRLNGVNLSNYGNIGLGAVDLGPQTNASTNGATGQYSTILGGFNSNASGQYSSVIGGNNSSASGTNSSILGSSSGNAQGDYSTVVGTTIGTAYGQYSAIFGGGSHEAYEEASTVIGGVQNISNARYSLTGGFMNTAQSPGEVSLGLLGTNYTPTTTTSICGVTTDRIFNIGIGYYQTPDCITEVRKDGFTVYKNGGVKAPEITNSIINSIGAKSLISKEYLDSALSGLSSGVTSVNAQTGVVNLDANNIPETTTRKWTSPTEKTNWNNKQDALVSGTTIKTLEGVSLLGSGNIDLSKADVGLANVDNTSDANKPISTATQTALDLKQNLLTAGTDYVIPPLEMVLNADYTLTSSTSAQKLFNVGSSGNGAINVEASTLYDFELFVDLANLSATSGYFSFSLAGTATYTSLRLKTEATKAPLITSGGFMGIMTTASAYQMTISNVNTVGYMLIRGKIRTIGAGTLIPTITLSQASAGVVKANSYCTMRKIGNSSFTASNGVN